MTYSLTQTSHTNLYTLSNYDSIHLHTKTHQTHLHAHLLRFSYSSSHTH
uniref:Uncharacterized protein n=1 Tax=Anguilla anguilla TaxID=7936 RepID=A0A0E9UYG7_ANGAN